MTVLVITGASTVVVGPSVIPNILVRAGGVPVKVVVESGTRFKVAPEEVEVDVDKVVDREVVL